MKETVLKYVSFGFLDVERPKSKPIAGDIEPPPLFLTNGYKGNEQMLGFIKKAGLRMPSRPQSMSVGRTGQQAQAGTRGRTRSVSAHRGNMGPPKEPNFRGRVKENVAMKRRQYQKPEKKEKKEKLEWTSDDELTEEEKRTKGYLEARGRRKPDVEDLSEQLEEMKLKGIQASKRNKEKFLTFERRIRELRDEIGEKDRKNKELKEKLRDYKDDEQKMKDEIKDGKSKIRRLREQLAEADVDVDEWRRAYERISDDLGQKRRRK